MKPFEQALQKQAALYFRLKKSFDDLGLLSTSDIPDAFEAGAKWGFHLAMEMLRDHAKSGQYTFDPDLATDWLLAQQNKKE